MESKIMNVSLWWKFLVFLLSLFRSFALNSDGVLLLSFKYAILGDPLSVLESWNYNDQTPCSWNGVTCTEIGTPGTADMFRVTSLILPSSQLLGAIPSELGMIEHLRHLDLSNNFFNGSLPISISNASELQVLSLSNNVISGELSDSIGALKGLQFLNLSDNALAGKLPEHLTALQNLTVVSLKGNYFSGSVPSGFSFVEVLDLSSNLLNGSLPLEFGGENLRYLNFSYNKISGSIPPDFAKKVPMNSTIDLSFNNLTGAIPESLALLNQKTELFAGNENLCGKPLKNICSIPSSLSIPPNVSSPNSSPAIAAIPKEIGSNPVTSSPGTPNNTQTQSKKGLKPSTIAGIAIGDLAGLAVLSLIILYVYQLRKRRNFITKNPSNSEKITQLPTKQEHQESKQQIAPWSCFALKGEETSEAASSDGEEREEKTEGVSGRENNGNYTKGGVLVSVDGETELELETLLKASAYILGTSGGSIVYKAVLENGTAFAVRRIGESGVENVREFENQVRAIAKLRHPNLVRIRGFYWGKDEKLVIYDYVSNGSLATSSYRKSGSSPSHLPFEVRLKIARGIARGLAFIHDKKQVHGNIKPSNVLLNSVMEPLISDFGLEKLIFGNTSNKASGSARNLGSQRYTIAREGLQEISTGSSPAGSSVGCSSAYQSPESLKNLKANPKWDVYSFGIILLELLSGRIFSERELAQWNAGMLTDENRVTRMTDVAIRGEVEGREEATVACFRLGFSCVSFVPQKRPTMKEALQILDKISSTSSR